MNNRNFSRKVAALLSDYSALPLESKAETLTNLRHLLMTVKSRRMRETLRRLEDFFKSELAEACRKRG